MAPARRRVLRLAAKRGQVSRCPAHRRTATSARS
jgi:hypothetical protein